MNKESERDLMAYGRTLMARVAGRGPGTDPPWVVRFLDLLNPQRSATAADGPLRSIFTLIDLKEPARITAEPGYLRAVALDLTADDHGHWAWEPVGLAEAQASDRSQLYRKFAAADDPQSDFLRFFHLMRRYASGLPNDYGEPGVSLFEQWKMMAALVAASGGTTAPIDRFTLIGGDIPGIQDFVYTITSKGAAKGLRGRSVFLQLLGDAVVRRLLADLDLCPANVIYNAGGNFAVLGPPHEKASKCASELRRRANGQLVVAIQGETALVLESMPVTAAELFRPDRFRAVRDDFAEQIARAKAQPLRELADDWPLLFEPGGKGSPLSCAVCRVEVDEQNSRPLEDAAEIAEGAESTRICFLCDSFRDLADDIRHQEVWLTVTEKPSPQPAGSWADLLARMTGFHYGFTGKRPAGEGIVLALNRIDFLEAGADGYRLLANVTPTVTAKDVTYLREREKLKPEELPKVGDIRSFELLAYAAAETGAIARVGVLRMDVDRLGTVFSEGLPELTLSKLSTLSAAVDLFFSGYLNTLVRKQAPNDLYTIYAGGDDLFIVGAWQHLPDLAWSIRKAFKEFVGQHPMLSLSGGITLEGAKFPLYRAAERAGEAEGKAKDYVRPDGRRKDAFCFLDTVVGWEDWESVQAQKDNLLWLIGATGARADDEVKRRPRAVLQIVQAIFHLYRAGLRDARRRVRRENRDRPADKKLPLPKPQMFFGRWAWMQAYSLTHLAQRNKDAANTILKVQEQLMSPATVRYSGLAARWAEYLTRGNK